MKTKTKLASILLALCVLIGAIGAMPLRVSALEPQVGFNFEYEFVEGSTFGGLLTYEIISDGKVEIVDAEADIVDLIIPPVVEYNGYTYTVVGISTVVASGGLHSVFRNSSATLQTVNFVNKGTTTPKLTEIGDYAFSMCTELASINIPDTVKIISDCAFEECSALKSITVPSGIEHIGDYAFYKSGLSCELNFPASLSAIGKYAFGDTDITALTIEDGNVPLIVDNGACYSALMLSKAALPNRVTSIGNDAFYGCGKLEEIEIPIADTMGTSILASCWILDRITFLVDKESDIDTYDTYSELHGWLQGTFEAKDVDFVLTAPMGTNLGYVPFTKTFNWPAHDMADYYTLSFYQSSGDVHIGNYDTKANTSDEETYYDYAAKYLAADGDYYFTVTAVNSGNNRLTARSSPSEKVYINGYTVPSTMPTIAPPTASITSIAHIDEDTVQLSVSTSESVVLYYNFDGSTAYVNASSGTHISGSGRTFKIDSVPQSASKLYAYMRSSAPNGGSTTTSINIPEYIPNYTVTYDANGGTGAVTDSHAYAPGSGAAVLGAEGLTAPTEKIFAGWNTKANGSGVSYAAGSTITVTANVTLYAQWTYDYDLPQTVNHIHTDGTCFDVGYGGFMSGGTIGANTNIVLTAATSIDANLIIDSGVTVNICLNAQTLDLGKSYIKNSGVLTVCDCAVGGQIIGGGSYCIYNENDNASIMLLSGTVNNTSGSGYAVFNHLGTVTVSGGKVCGAYIAMSNYSDAAALNIFGGTVEGELYAVNNNSSLYLSGTPTMINRKENGANISAGIGMIYGAAPDGTPYAGEPLTVRASNSCAAGDVIVRGADRSKFSLVNNQGYEFGQREGNLVLRAVHTHGAWSYSALGNTITATCGKADCDIPAYSEVLTITAPAMTVYGDGKTANAALSAGSLGEYISLPAIRYVGRDGTAYEESEIAPVGAGSYTASITLGGETMSVNYEIAKSDAPIVDTESEEPLVNTAPEASDTPADAESDTEASVEHTHAEEPGQEGLSDGAMAAIIGSGAVILGGGGFALWWFVFKKKRA